MFPVDGVFPDSNQDDFLQAPEKGGCHASGGRNLPYGAGVGNRTDVRARAVPRVDVGGEKSGGAPNVVTMSDTATLEARAQELLQELAGPEASFREHQWEAVRELVADRAGVLCVQRTGWGKSAVYFLATALLRERGAGPALIVSPLLALMRNQIAAAERLGISALTINSTNRDEWDEVRDLLADDAVDLLLISPERLNNPRFRQDMLPLFASRVGLVVVDEVGDRLVLVVAERRAGSGQRCQQLLRVHCH